MHYIHTSTNTVRVLPAHIYKHGIYTTSTLCMYYIHTSTNIVYTLHLHCTCTTSTHLQTWYMYYIHTATNMVHVLHLHCTCTTSTQLQTWYTHHIYKRCTCMTSTKIHSWNLFLRWPWVVDRMLKSIAIFTCAFQQLWKAMLMPPMTPCSISAMKISARQSQPWTTMTMTARYLHWGTPTATVTATVMVTGMPTVTWSQALWLQWPGWWYLVMGSTISVTVWPLGQHLPAA